MSSSIRLVKRALLPAGRLLRDKRGNILVLAAAGMPLVIGAAGLAIDTIQASMVKRELQRTADSGALAGAFAIVQSKSPSDAVTRILQATNALSLSAAPDVQNAPRVGAYASDPRAVRVQLASSPSLPFMAFFGVRPTLSAAATATLVYSGKYCMIALDNGAGTGIKFSGTTRADFGCGAISNRTGASSVTADGNARVVASPIAAVGGVPASSAYLQPTVLLPRALKQPDPFIGLPQPVLPSTCENKLNVQPNTAVSIGPGGCYKGMDIKGTLNLAPGTYYIDGAPNGAQMQLSATASLIGTGVTIILTSSNPTSSSSFATVDVHANATVQLSAPKSGTYEGVIFYQDRRAPIGTTTINGNSSSIFEGSFYFPTQNLIFNGTADMKTDCIQLVARTLEFTGTSSVKNTCPADGGAKAFDASWVRLVE